ncbi:hypothetical protein G5B47_18565 [Paenibacillus sp. 7124]|uniref:Uncharacterized protein n=1 Tax=Paenibacillus apii TaxID=1850370 RepID=A0A6M1PL99_9BACL|nr:hypothetical protein [Paenibacillus apii]NGM84417.1 hypothetical protein [Paenibacillus apii]NJJ38367.1 hypothetical protein [Paenibacillus apii]
MNRQLIGDTLRLLQAELSPIAGIQLPFSPAEGDGLLSVMDSYNLEYSRKMHFMGMYIILVLAARRHMECAEDHPDLIRNVLDGDYLYSFYLQFAIKHRELDFVVFLAPYIKQQQVRRANGDYTELDLTALIGQFLNAEFKKKRRSEKAIEQVG